MYFTPYNSTPHRKSRIQMCSYLFISHLLRVSCTEKNKSKNTGRRTTCTASGVTRQRYHPSQPSVGKVERVEWVAALVWPDRSNQSSVTPIRVGSRRTPIERQRNKKNKKKQNHCHHVFVSLYQGQHKRRHTNGSDSCHLSFCLLSYALELSTASA